eukprot:9800561-Ditylum_brightwellii.AAC.1
MGVWGNDLDGISSNLKEIINLVDALEAEGAQGNSEGTEVFFFGDNSTAESAYYCGTSSRKLLFDQVLQLHEQQMQHKCSIHIIHCAGTQMLSQGTDGVP